jgi:hypothetical protein
MRKGLGLMCAVALHTWRAGCLSCIANAALTARVHTVNGVMHVSESMLSSGGMGVSREGGSCHDHLVTRGVVVTIVWCSWHRAGV